VRLDTDPYLSRYADRVTGLAASEIRALFSVVERPEIVSFAGGMPDLSVVDLDAVADLTADVIREQGRSRCSTAAARAARSCARRSSTSWRTPVSGDARRAARHRRWASRRSS
jgi:DNA-binding transcriptional MocR family regulator